MAKVELKNLGNSLEIKTTGLEFGISNGSHVGDLYVSKTGIIWCAGKTARENGKKIKWKELRDWCKKA